MAAVAIYCQRFRLGNEGSEGNGWTIQRQMTNDEDDHRSAAVPVTNETEGRSRWPGAGSRSEIAINQVEKERLSGSGSRLWNVCTCANSGHVSISVGSSLDWIGLPIHLVPQ